jgi:AbrB family looped-hinge helix DNA binding protein
MFTGSDPRSRRAKARSSSLWTEPSAGQIGAKRAGIHLDPEQSWANDLEETGRRSHSQKGSIRLNWMTITKLDANGKVLLPLDIRFKLDLNAGDRLAIDQLGDGTIIIKKPAIGLGLRR